jgi:hypothetical protein
MFGPRVTVGDLVVAGILSEKLFIAVRVPLTIWCSVR